jgi:hypothetical protein
LEEHPSDQQFACRRLLIAQIAIPHVEICWPPWTAGVQCDGATMAPPESRQQGRHAMDISRSILAPLGSTARNLSDAARNQIADIDTNAIRERVSRMSKQFAHSARDAAHAAGDVATPYLHKIARTSQKQLAKLGDALEANARKTVRRWDGKSGNMITRHPVAATLLFGSLSYLAYLAWTRARAKPVAAAAKPKRAPRKAAARTARGSNSAARSKQVHATRSTSIN